MFALFSISIVVAASPYECMIHTINCMYSKIAPWRWTACLFKTCRRCYQNKIQEDASSWFYYTRYLDSLYPLTCLFIQLFFYWHESYHYRQNALTPSLQLESFSYCFPGTEVEGRWNWSLNIILSPAGICSLYFTLQHLFM